MIGPPAHHLHALLPLRAAMIDGAHTIAVRMRQGASDGVGRPFAALVQERRSHGAQAVRGHLALGVAEAGRKHAAAPKKKSPARAGLEVDDLGASDTESETQPRPSWLRTDERPQGNRVKAAQPRFFIRRCHRWAQMKGDLIVWRADGGRNPLICAHPRHLWIESSWLPRLEARAAPFIRLPVRREAGEE